MARDDAFGRLFNNGRIERMGRRFGERSFQVSSDGGGGKIKAGAHEIFRKRLLAEARRQGFELLCHESEELGILVGRDRDLHKSVWTFLLKFAHPVGDGFYGDTEGFSRLVTIPASGGFVEKNGHAFRWGIMRSILGWNLLDTSLKYADLFLEQSDFVVSLLDL